VAVPPPPSEPPAAHLGSGTNRYDLGIEVTCGYHPPAEPGRCDDAAALHIITFDPAFYVDTAVVTCHRHARDARAIGEIRAVHRVGEYCDQPGSVWILDMYATNACLPAMPDLTEDELIGVFHHADIAR
jgi:hypothetical protein